MKSTRDGSRDSCSETLCYYFNMQSIYKHSLDFPYHISVGAVFFNEKNEIACEVFPSEVIQKLVGLDCEMRMLMRETIENGETITDAVHRGLLEELGMKGTILGFLGSKEDLVIQNEKTFQKTTLYFLVKADVSGGIPLVGKDDWVNFSIEWLPIDALVQKMQLQAEGLEREDLNESDILERARKYLL
jgi:hypothetical protein